MTNETSAISPKAVEHTEKSVRIYRPSAITALCPSWGAAGMQWRSTRFSSVCRALLLRSEYRVYAVFSA
jgi:hypothetical protein